MDPGFALGGKKPWQERLRIAEEKRALTALRWENEVRARATAKARSRAAVDAAEAELTRLRKRRADILTRQRHRRAMAATKADPKSTPRFRPAWGYTGSPGTVENISKLAATAAAGGAPIPPPLFPAAAA
eukprot:4341-Pelagococcus_subviridis.AAC.1